MTARHTLRLLARLSVALTLAVTVAVSSAACASRGATGLDARQANNGFAAATSPATETVAGEPLPAEPATSVATPTVFAVIGDYGAHSKAEAAVARLVQSWHPAFIVTTGDDYYKLAGGSGSTRYLRSTGYLYGRWMAGVPRTPSGRIVGTARVNSFFPTLGNHDYGDAKPGPCTYLGYFTLPGTGFTNSSGNERYYDFVDGPVHFFMLNSNPQEPDGISASSTQAAWLRRSLKASSATWNVVIFHHPPYSSDNRHGSTSALQWPFATWGADAVLSGHAHVYERVMHGELPYFVNGLGGAQRYGTRKAAVAGSRARYSANWGAQRVTANASTIAFEFYNVRGRLQDRFTMSR